MLRGGSNVYQRTETDDHSYIDITFSGLTDLGEDEDFVLAQHKST